MRVDELIEERKIPKGIFKFRPFGGSSIYIFDRSGDKFIIKIYTKGKGVSDFVHVMDISGIVEDLPAYPNEGPFQESRFISCLREILYNNKIKFSFYIGCSMKVVRDYGRYIFSPKEMDEIREILETE